MGEGEKKKHFIPLKIEAKRMIMKPRKLFSLSISLSFSFSKSLRTFLSTAADIYLPKINNKNLRVRCAICLKMTNIHT